LADYWVTIAIPEGDNDRFMSIFDALVSEPDPAVAVGHTETTGGPSDYTLLLDADDAYAAAMEATATFRAAVATSEVAEVADSTIVDLRAERVPDDVLREWTVSERTT
jgi:hypothetical protein